MARGGHADAGSCARSVVKDGKARLPCKAAPGAVLLRPAAGPEGPMRSRFLPLVTALPAVLSACSNKDGVVEYNTAPEASITRPTDGATVEAGEPVTFEATVYDGQDPLDALEIILSSDLEAEPIAQGQLADSTGYFSYTTANLVPGNHVITLTVIDSNATSGSDSISLGVLEVEQAPTIAIIHPVAGEYGVSGTEFEFKAEVHDAQDAPGDLLVEFASDVDGVFCNPVPAGDGIANCLADLTLGDHLLTFTVTDTDANSTSATASFTVVSPDSIDWDGDGFSVDMGDCDDNNDTIHPGAKETPNGLDDDCDTLVDEGTTVYDDDGDGQSEVAGDCDDGDPHTYQGAPEVCDGVDNDCDLTVDEGTDCYDDDGDGYTEEDGDCNDSSNTVHPGAAEVCGNGIDDNCNGTQNEVGAIGCLTYYPDADGDGFGDASSAGSCQCEPDSTYITTNNSDCYDGDADANPNQTAWFSSPRPDGSYDYDCDGVESKRWNAFYDCTWLCLADSTDGWLGRPIPACAATDRFGEDCWALTSDLCEPYNEFNRTQECR